MEGEREPVTDINNENVKSGVTRLIPSPNIGPQEQDETSPTSSSSFNNLFGGNSPFENPVILNHLFQLCPSSLLASCRLVCKQWYKESLTTWRTAFPFSIVLHDDEICLGPGFYFKRAPPPIRTSLQEFLEFIDEPDNQCSTKPYRNMKLGLWEYKSNPTGINLLWKSTGSSLTILNLSHCRFANIEDFRQIVYKFCHILQKLEINFCEFLTQNTSSREEDNELEYKEPQYGEHKHLKNLYVKDSARTWTFSWMDIFSHFSSLAVLTFSSNHPESAEVDTILKVIRRIRKTDKKKLPFKHFEVSWEPASHRQLALVKELRLPLTCCSYEFCQNDPELDLHYLKDRLNYMPASIKTMRIVQPRIDSMAAQVLVPACLQDFPFGIHFQNLTILALDGGLCWSFTFLKYMPNLTTLSIVENTPKESKDEGKRVKEFKSGTAAVSNTCKDELANLKMVRLSLLGLEYIVSNDDILQLNNWMPDITYLSMILNDEQLGMVCQNWKNLKSLDVLGSLATAEGITGIRAGKVTGEADIPPHITSLKSLEYLTLSDSFTPESVFHLFLHLPSLHYLTFDQSTEKTFYRDNLDMAGYQQAIKDGVLEQWIADNRSMLESGEDDDDLEEDYTSESD